MEPTHNSTDSVNHLLTALTLLQKPRIFSGEPGEDVRDFIEYISETIPGPDEANNTRRINFLFDHLAGAAKEEAQASRYSNRNVTPEEILKRLETIFTIDNSGESRLDIMKARTWQPNETIVQYFSAKRNLLVRAGIPNDSRDANYWLLLGMGKHYLKTFINHLSDKTDQLLKEIIEQVNTMEKAEKDFRTFKSPPRTTGQNLIDMFSDVEKETVKIRQAEEKEESSHTPPHAPPQHAEYDDTLVQRLAAELAKINSSQGASDNQQAQQHRVPCEICGRTNHKTADCYQNPNNRRNGQRSHHQQHHGGNHRGDHHGHSSHNNPSHHNNHNSHHHSKQHSSHHHNNQHSSHHHGNNQHHQNHHSGRAEGKWCEWHESKTHNTAECRKFIEAKEQARQPKNDNAGRSQK